MKTQNRILEAIHKSAIKFLLPLNPPETYSTIANEAIKLVKADSAVIHLYVGREFKVVYASLKKFYSIKPRKKANIYQAFITKKPLTADAKDIIQAHKELKHQKIRSAIFIPLTSKNKSIGVLALNSSKDEYFSKKEKEILKLFGSLASLAIIKSQLYDEVKQALDARDLLISMTAHELRTPMTTVSGYAQLLHSKFYGSNTVESRWVEELTWESNRLAGLIDEMLEVERIKAGDFKYHLKECSLKVIVNQGLKNFRFNHPEYSILLEDQVGDNYDQIIGDFDKLLQVINNLLDNAAKFSPPDKTITVTIKLQQQCIIVRIKDLGCGIPKAEQLRIFEKFYRMTNHTREGMGLGLFLSQNIISQHGGIIRVKSKENVGTTVEIRLPKIKYDQSKS